MIPMTLLQEGECLMRRLSPEEQKALLEVLLGILASLIGATISSVGRLLGEWLLNLFS